MILSDQLNIFLRRLDVVPRNFQILKRINNEDCSKKAFVLIGIRKKGERTFTIKTMVKEKKN